MATAYNTQNVLVGAAAMYVQPYNAATPPVLPPNGQPFSDVSSASFTGWGSPWVFVGATEQGVTFGVQKNTTNIDIEEQSTPVFVSAQTTAITVGVSFAEDTLQTMKLAYGGGTLATQALSALRTVTDGTTTSGSPNLGSATAAFATADIGKAVTGTGIPANTYILSVTNGTTAVLTNPATATGASLSVTIGALPVISTLTLQEGIDILSVGFEGRNEVGGPRRVLIPQMQVSGQVSTPMRRAAAKRLYPVTFNSISAPGLTVIRNIGA